MLCVCLSVVMYSAMAGWSPSQTILDQIVQLLKESHSPDTEIQRNVEQVSSLVLQY